MIARLTPQMERARCLLPGGEEIATGAFGPFKISGPLGMELRIIASDGRDWESRGLSLPVWEHVSVSLATRCPTWKEMEWVRDQFWAPEELVLQFSVPRSQHISLHPYTLHLWRPLGVDVPLPPTITV
jgi:hypothetical protein